MAKQQQAPHKDKRKKQPKVKPPLIKPLAPKQAGSDGLFEGGDIQSQAAMLGETPWQMAQQRELATRIGQAQGNRHLQRVIALSKSGEGTTQTLLALADTPFIQRLSDEEKAINLSSPRFAGDPRLETVFDNDPLMKWGEKGEAVKKVQQALIDDGFAMPISTEKTGGPDGIFGNETFNTVKQFQQKYGLSIDGIVGRETMGQLDKLAGGSPGPKPEEPKPEEPKPEPKPEEPKPEEPKPEPPKTGLSYEEAKKKIMANTEEWGTDEEGIYTAIRTCYERDKLAADPEVDQALKDELSGHELWKAELLLAFGDEAAFPEPIKEIWQATEGWGTDEDRIYQALQKLNETEVAKINKVRGLWAMLRSELSGKDMNAAEGLLSGEYAKALARHKTNVTFVKAEIEKMRDPSKPTHVRNTAEWLVPSDPSQKPKNNLFVLTPTHDSVERAKEHGKKDEVAYFGDAPQFPADSADYDAHISSKRNIHYSAPSVAGEHLGKDIWMHDSAFQTNISLEQVLVHEVQHDADRHDTEEGHDKAFKSPEESWNRYKTEFRAYWLDGQRDSLSARSGSATAPWDNEKQEAIFKHMYGSSETDVYAIWLRPNYDKDKKVNGQNFKDLVHGYTKPEGVNLINSPRIDNFFLGLEKCKKTDTDLTKTPLLELDAAANAFDADDRTYVNSAEAARLQQMMKDKLASDPLNHIAKIVNGGTLPGWI